MLDGERREVDFFQYWESMGFFDSMKHMLPPKFFMLFEIARIIFSEDKTTEAYEALQEMTKEEKVFEPDRKESIQINRLEKIAPIGDRMEIETYKNINDLKRALPRELALDELLDVKIFTKSLLVQRFFETEADSFRPITTSRDQKGKDATRFEQKCYILLDRSKSMEVKMRTFYAKCIVAEFLRRKLESKAKLFYRPFDSKAGKLFKIEKREDFPRLIEEVLLTTTGGTSTNIEIAVNQAISDIKFDKEMMKTEILVVTDGISKIDKNLMKFKLGDIKLNVLKIGDEIPEPDFFELEGYLKGERLDFDPTMINIRDIKKQVNRIQSGDDSGMSTTEKRVFRLIFDISDKMFKDLKEISDKYIEIKDLEMDGLFQVDDTTLKYINEAIDRFYSVDMSGLHPEEKDRLFKQTHFLSQYIQMLLENGNAENQRLVNASERVAQLKQQLLKDPELLWTFMEVKEFKEDREMMKLAKKQAKQLLKQMQLDSRKLSSKEMRAGQLLFTMDVGKGSMGQFLMLIFIKIYDFIKKIVTMPFAALARGKQEGDPDDGKKKKR
ncbi:MAG: hypothetical protein MUD12_11400 [Spirochaetes bacterium]|nr:hypothetical protein [Spirochaetota bacterium]